VTRETLDETLDRVAAEMTTTAPDAAFVMRLRPRLDAPARHGFVLKTLAAGACIMALALSGALLRTSDRDAGHVASMRRPAIDRPATAPLANPSAPTETFASRVQDVVSTNRAAAPASVSSQPAHLDSTIPPLSPLPDLDLAHLEFDALVVHPMDVSSLQIDGLSVTELGGAEEPKE